MSFTRTAAGPLISSRRRSGRNRLETHRSEEFVHVFTLLDLEELQLRQFPLTRRDPPLRLSRGRRTRQDLGDPVPLGGRRAAQFQFQFQFQFLLLLVVVVVVVVLLLVIIDIVFVVLVIVVIVVVPSTSLLNCDSGGDGGGFGGLGSVDFDWRELDLGEILSD
ncbi:hypothetical protein TorRG33x02_336870 [Trema orientale]|uniref:Transmembrane protein n=1 Tax=Trema orientale TaxID=63057 RepID=A0A2P5AZM2_TREOI|nr:hypothetical protein TorRG33x02_336870 [Trema orientale]